VRSGAFGVGAAAVAELIVVVLLGVSRAGGLGGIRGGRAGSGAAGTGRADVSRGIAEGRNTGGETECVYPGSATEFPHSSASARTLHARP
jgi:hypothetical protein